MEIHIRAFQRAFITQTVFEQRAYGRFPVLPRTAPAGPIQGAGEGLFAADFKVDRILFRIAAHGTILPWLMRPDHPVNPVNYSPSRESDILSTKNRGSVLSAASAASPSAAA